jgi:hypothetical protein
VDPTRQAPIPDEQFSNRRNCGGFLLFFFFLLFFGGWDFIQYIICRDGKFGFVLNSYGKKENALWKPLLQGCLYEGISAGISFAK